jgi:flagellar capping protein FliD
MPIETIITALSAGIAAFAGLSKALYNSQERLNKRFEKIEDKLDSLEDRLIRDYVLKEDFLREMQAVHSKLDRILDRVMR